MKTRKIDLYTTSLLIVSILASALRSFALLTSFDYTTMYFTDKIAISISYILVAISVIGFLSYLIFGEKDRGLIARSDNAASFIPAGLVSTALMFMGVQNLTLLEDVYFGRELKMLAIVSSALAFLSVISFFLSIFIENKDSTFKALFSLSIVFFLAIYAMLLYFNKQVHPTNSPNRFIDEMAYLSASLFFLYEARIPLGREKWRGYVAFGLCATLLCSYSAIPSLVLYFVNDHTVSESLIESILTLTIAIFILSRVLQIKTLTVDNECEEAKSIAQLAAMRDDEIREMHENPSSNITNKEEIDSDDVANYTFDLPETDAEDTEESAENTPTE